MKNLLYSCGFLFVISCQNQEASIEQETIVPEQKKQDLILGDWNMDSSVFINDGLRGVVSSPLMPTIWNFGDDGSYLVKNSVSMTGTFSRTDDSLFVVLMAVPNEYEILVLNETNLHLRSTIIETDSASMKTDAYLSRK
jgi:hypothetical protein